MDDNSLDPTEDKLLMSKLILLHSNREEFQNLQSELSLEDQIAAGRQNAKERASMLTIRPKLSDQDFEFRRVYQFFRREANDLIESEKSGILGICSEQFRKMYDSTVKEFGFSNWRFLIYIEKLRNSFNTIPQEAEPKQDERLSEEDIARIKRKYSVKKLQIMKQKRILSVLDSKRILKKKRRKFAKNAFDMRKSVLHKRFRTQFTSATRIRCDVVFIRDEKFRLLFNQTIRVLEIPRWVLTRFAKRVPRCTINVRLTPAVQGKTKPSKNLITFHKNKIRELTPMDRRLRWKFLNHFKSLQ